MKTLTEKPMSKAEELRQEKANAEKYLREWLKPKDTVHTILRHVSQSGMSRNISCVIVNNGQIKNITYYVAKYMDYTIAKDGGIKIGGCGMDMGFHLVYSLSYRLFKGQTAKEDSGYTLNQEWL